MVAYTLVRNPFEPHNVSPCFCEDGKTPWELFASLGLDSEPLPIICVLNAKPLKREDWSTVLKDGDSVIFSVVLGDLVSIIIAIVVLVVAVVVSVALTGAQSSATAAGLADTPEADPVFTLRGQQNSNKRGQSIERPYGRFRHWPSYAAAPWTRFIDNDAWLFQVFCIGHGEYDIHTIYIEDTPLNQFRDVEYEIIRPGESLTLFPDNVFTSTEVGGVELYGTNEPEHTGFTAPFVACPANERTQILEVDLALPRGLYYSNDAGGLDTRTVTVEIQYRAIDDFGSPAGDWTVGRTWSAALATNTPQRFTLSILVELGRYEVKVKRTNDSELSHRGGDTVNWTALRAFLPSVRIYPGVTLLAIKARATNNLNDSASSRVNVSATAKLPVWTPDAGWIPDVGTRNPVWAFCDIYTAAYGGNLPTRFLNIQHLYDLSLVFDAEGVTFDWIFEQKTTTWEAAKAVAKICRAVPMLHGSRISMVRDSPQLLPALFNENNIVANSLSWEVKLKDINDHDGLEIEYTNAETWLTETVLCLANGDLGETPKIVKLPGCTSRTLAYRIGMYMRLSETLVRSQIVFKTGMEGLSVSYGSLIAVNHTFPQWGQGGRVLSIVGNLVTLDAAVTFTEGPHYLLIRTKIGDVFGPHVVTQVSSKSVRLLVAPDTSQLFSTNGELPLFLFGRGGEWGRLFKVTAMNPGSEDDVEISATIYNPSLFDYVNATPPQGYTPFSVPVLDALPQLSGLRVSQNNSITKVNVVWSALQQALHYVVELSYDNVAFSKVWEGTTNYTVLDIVPGYAYIRVYGVRTAAGQSATWSGTVGVDRPLPSNVAGVTLDAFAFMLSVHWTASTNADGYRVRIFTKPSGGSYEHARTFDVDGTSFDYSYTQAVADNKVNRFVRLLVSAINIKGTSAVPTELEVSNPLPDAVTGLTSTIVSISILAPLVLSWTPSTATDIAFYRVETSPTTDFTNAAILYQGPGASCQLSLPWSSSVYWRVGVADIWGPEVVWSEHSVASHYL